MHILTRLTRISGILLSSLKPRGILSSRESLILATGEKGLLRIKPPFIRVVGLAISQDIIHLDDQAAQKRHVLDHPPDDIVDAPFRLIPRAYLNTATTHRAIGIPEPKSRTPIGMKRVFFIAVMDLFLFIIRDGLGRAFNRTLLTFLAKGLEPEINRLIGFER